MSTYQLILRGGSPDEVRISAKVLHEALGALFEGVRLATRFAVEGESVRRGPRPSWLDSVCEFDVRGLSAGSTVIAMEAGTLKELAPERFSAEVQPSLFGESGSRVGEQTAIDIFGQRLAAALESERDEILADRALLDAYVKFARISGRGCDEISLEGIRGRAAPLVIRSNDARRIEFLRDETPESHAARVAGTLDTVSASHADVVLTLKDGTRVPARMEEHDVEVLRSLLGKEVVVSGMAHYRPSGRLLFLDVEALDSARPEDRIFEKAPAARRQKVILGPPDSSEASGVAAFFGVWPGDETDAQLLEALRGGG